MREMVFFDANRRIGHFFNGGGLSALCGIKVKAEGRRFCRVPDTSRDKGPG